MQSPDRHDLPGNALLKLARSSIRHGLVHDEPIPVDCDDVHPALAEVSSTFTTLTLSGELRGCRGTLKAVHPLAMDVARSAFQAAFRDPRFEPVREEEFDTIRLEVSVLSSLQSISATDEADLLGQLTPGIDGLVILAHGRSATFLPDVWKMLPDPGRFLAALKTKCGLADDYWSESLEFQRYRTRSFAEPG